MTDHDPRPFAEALRDRRLLLGLTQAEAASMVGASEKSWRRWEQGDTPDEKFLTAIRDQLGVAATPAPTPEMQAADALAELERSLAAVREGLSRATNVRADLILRRADTSTVLVNVKAFHTDTASGLEGEVVDLITRAAHHAGWTVHLTP